MFEVNPPPPECCTQRRQQIIIKQSLIKIALPPNKGPLFSGVKIPPRESRGGKKEGHTTAQHIVRWSPPHITHKKDQGNLLYLENPSFC